MKTPWMTCVISAGLLVGCAVAARAGQASKSVWDGVYTEAQAKKGAQVYVDHCLRCHGDTLQGDGTASALTGPGFTADFEGATLAELVDRTKTTMPDDKPGSMSRQQVADVLAYLLSFN